MSTEAASRIVQLLIGIGPEVMEAVAQVIEAIKSGERVRAARLAFKATTLMAYKRKIRG